MFQRNIIEGEGVLVKLDGSRYEGKMSSGMKHGRGTLITPDGNRFIGK